MSQFFFRPAVLRGFATVAFSLVSYAAVAQSAPKVDACGNALSAFQQRLYMRYVAGPDALRQYIFALHGIRQLDVLEVDAWARSIRYGVCPTDGPAVHAADANDGSGTAGDEPARRSRAEVRQELALARAARQLQFGER